MKNKKHLSIEELKSKMDTGASFILVDVLSHEDFKGAHIKGAINIPLDDLETKGGQWLNRSIDIIVYSANAQCKGAGFAQEKLGTMGFRVWKLDGGLEAWENAQYPIDGNPNYKPHMTKEKPKSLQPQPKAPPAPEKTAEAPEKKEEEKEKEPADRPWERYSQKSGAHEPGHEVEHPEKKPKGKGKKKRAA